MDQDSFSDGKRRLNEWLVRMGNLVVKLITSIGLSY